jgi:hypothetical protein
MIEAQYANRGTWPSHTGGDHTYTKQLTAKIPLKWIDGVILASAQENKGHGRKLDAGKKIITDVLDDNESVFVKPRVLKAFTPYYEKYGKVKNNRDYVITYDGIKVVSELKEFNNKKTEDEKLVELHNYGRRTYTDIMKGVYGNYVNLEGGKSIFVPECIAVKYSKLYPCDLRIISV